MGTGYSLRPHGLGQGPLLGGWRVGAPAQAYSQAPHLAMTQEPGNMKPSSLAFPVSLPLVSRTAPFRFASPNLMNPVAWASPPLRLQHHQQANTDANQQKSALHASGSPKRKHQGKCNKIGQTQFVKLLSTYSLESADGSV